MFRHLVLRGHPGRLQRARPGGGGGPAGHGHSHASPGARQEALPPAQVQRPARGGGRHPVRRQSQK